MEEKKVLVAYTVKVYEDGGRDVEDAKLEGTQPLSAEQIYKDIEDTAKIIEQKRIENAAYAGVRRFYEQIAAEQAKQEEAEVIE